MILDFFYGIKFEFVSLVKDKHKYYENTIDYYFRKHYFIRFFTM